ncbi:MAG: DMT family transporter [Nannocystaceae bacterium]
MQLYLIIPLVLGALAVLQAALNRRILIHLGLSYTVILNATVLFLVSSAFAVLVRRFPDLFPAAFRGELATHSFRWWFLVPGCCGFFLVSGVPWTFSKVGALQVFVGIVAAQVVASALWDASIEGHPLTPARIAGGMLAVAAVALVSWRS